ncbi:MAG: hypothetical protein B6D46_03130 [Polyangiaceae bacterium UTPRO1]|jgi:hypothetical protein|nr:MAG: hypothetical protein B6D46_03130 [Polyangiaceae bacterium UTPRO1]
MAQSAAATEVVALRSTRGRNCLLVLTVVLASASAASCRPDSDPAAPAIVSPRFTDVTAAAGIARTAQTYDAAVGDFDGDGEPDLYVGNHATGGMLLRNQGGGRFVDVLSGSGIAPRGDQHGCGWGDYDNDGRLDLHVALGAGRGLAAKANRLYHNEGGGRFRDVAAAAGVADPTGRARSTAWLDVDRDGWLDLLTVNWASPSTLFRNRRDGTFEDVSAASGIGAYSATRLAWADVDGDGYPDLVLSGTRDGLRFLHNDAGRRFVDWTDRSGLGAARSVQGMAFGDYDNDGILDLYVSSGSDFSDVVLAPASDRVTFAFFAHEAPTGFDFEGGADVHAELYENGSLAAVDRIRCGPTWRPETASFRCSTDAAASADPPEGALGFFLWREPAGREPCTGCPAVYQWHLRWRGAGDHHLSGILEGARRPASVGLGSPPRTGGSLWRGRADGRFVRTAPRGLEHDADGQAVAWADVNDDGWLDLYVVDSGVDGAGGRNVLFVNDGRGGFIRQDAASGATPSSGGGRGVGAHFFDFDGDGRQDLFLTNGWGAPPFDHGPYVLLHNETPPAHWLDVVLEGVRSNRQGLGARVEVTACDRRQIRLHTGGSNYFSQSAIGPHFGLGDCARIETLTVAWPSGIVQRVADPGIDGVVRVREPDAAVGGEL